MAPLIQHENKVISITVAAILIIILLIVSAWLIKFNLKWYMTDKPLKPISPIIVAPNTNNFARHVVPLFMDEKGNPCNDC